jgi:uncharacterized membrane protein
MGPVEYVVIEFEGNHFTGEILPELRALDDRGITRVVDLVLIQKDKDGNVTVRELSDLSAEEARPYGPIAGHILHLLAREDIEDVAREIPNNSSVALTLLEHTWAARLRELIVKAQGRVIDAGLVAAAEVEALGAELAAQDVPMHG